MTFPNFEDSCKSLLKKYLTKELFAELKDKKTASGFTLEQAINSGVKNQASKVGIYAGDEESYTLFAKLFNPIIEDYHAPYKVSQKHPRDLNVDKLQLPNLDPEGKYILSPRIRVARSVKGYPLGPGISKEQRNQLEQAVVGALKSLTGELAGTYYPLKEMDDATKKRLIEEHFLFEQYDKYLDAAGMMRDWPDGRGIFFNTNKTFLVWVNEEDHLRIISMQSGADIEGVFRRLANAVNAIDKLLSFQYTDGLGYISSCPSNLGTGMRASVLVKLEKASKSPKFHETVDKYHLQARGTHGENSDMSASVVFDISNKRRLGQSEVDCVKEMYAGIKALLELEKSA